MKHERLALFVTYCQSWIKNVVCGIFIIRQMELTVEYLLLRLNNKGMKFNERSSCC